VTYDAVGDKLRSTFSTGWASAQPSIEWFGPNTGPDEEFANPWVALDVLDGQSLQINVSPPQYRRSGFVAVSIFVPVNSGDSLMRGLIDSAQGIFENKSLDDGTGKFIIVRGAEVIHVGSTERFTQTNVQFEYHYDDL
jgi:hypothetical protein